MAFARLAPMAIVNAIVVAVAFFPARLLACLLSYRSLARADGMASRGGTTTSCASDASSISTRLQRIEILRVACTNAVLQGPSEVVALWCRMLATHPRYKCRGLWFTLVHGIVDLVKSNAATAVLVWNTES